MGKRTTGLPRYVRRHHGGFRAVLDRDGRTLRSPTFPTAVEASAWAERALRAEVPDRPWTLQDGYEAVLQELEVNARPATRTYYRNHWRELVRDEELHFDPDAPLHAITPRAIMAYAAGRKQQGISDSTIWGKELQILSRILRLAEQEGQIATNPMRKVRQPKLRHRRFDCLPAERIDELLATIRAAPGRQRFASRDADVIDLLFSTGIRRAEAVRLQVDDVDLGTGQLRVDGKNGVRHLPIGDGVRPVFERLLAGARKGRLCGSEDTIEKLFARWAKRLGEPKLYPHAMRHSYGTAMARASVDPYVLKDLMGHETLQQTMRYYHTQSDRMRAAADAIPRRRSSEATPAASPPARQPSTATA